MENKVPGIETRDGGFKPARKRLPRLSIPRSAVVQTLQEDMNCMDAGKMGISTSEVGDRVAKYL